jgi:aldehyde dehydrogenase family 7 protein A1
MAQQLTHAKYPFLKELGIESENFGCYYDGKWVGSGPSLTIYNPSTSEPIATVKQANEEDYENAISSMQRGHDQWVTTPPPLRGEIIRQIGDALRLKKKALGALISLEMGKIRTEGEGEVQEFIDICDMACGLSRGLNGKVIPSERPEHFMVEQWNPLGLIGVITAFNFPCAVLGWNFAIAAVCGDLTCWKGASSTSLVTLATTRLIAEVLERNKCPPGVLVTTQGSGRQVGERMINDPRFKLISFTGSTSIGKRVSEIASKHFARTILELGGNNAVVVMDDASLELVLKGALFSAVGTAGQRCTTLRRLILHEKVYDKVVQSLVKAYATISIGDPLQEGTLMGPLHTKDAVREYEEGIVEILKQGGKILYGGKVLKDRKGNFVEPTIIEIDWRAPIVKEELFVPIMYVLKFSSLDEGIKINNSVPQGLSSSLFTNNVQHIMKWIGPLGSDCGIVNTNIGPSGAEIGGAFGGEKETGGGRESGSDSWKQYMRRSTCTINYGKALPLAQGVKFDANL